MAAKQKHPDVPGCVVRLTDDAVDDLQDLFRIDPQIVRWALKKMIQLERDPNASDPLPGGLIGYRKITVDDRDWRVVWRMQQDEVGDFLVEVAEVWAAGDRKDSEVYEEVARRVVNAGSSSKFKALSEVLDLFAKQAKDLTATEEPDLPEPVPKWLTDALRYVVHIPGTRVEAMRWRRPREHGQTTSQGQGRAIDVERPAQIVELRFESAAVERRQATPDGTPQSMRSASETMIPSGPRT